jgi:hypothetical protein
MDIWSWNNAIDAAGALVSSVSGDAGDMHANRIRDPRLGRIWRSGGSPNELRIALPASAGLSVLGVFGVNMAEIGLLTVSLGTTAGGNDVWEGTVDPTLTVGRRAIFVIQDANGALEPVTASHMTVASAGTTPLEIGRVWAGGADWQPEVGHIVNGSEWKTIDLSNRRVTPRTGAFHIDLAARRDTFTPAYDALTETEYAGAIRRMDRDRGLGSQMLFIPRTDVYDTNQWAILGYLQELPANRFVGYNRVARTMTIVENG